jgi:hypothetical protein
MNDPNQFPVYNLTGNDSNSEYKTIWELKTDFKEEFEELMGHNLFLKNSKIEHPDSGEGVFLSCKNRKFILPGTLLGFYPGSVNFHFVPKPKLEINSTLPYLNRYDGVWIDPSRKIPYPMKANISLEDFSNEEENTCSLNGTKEIFYKIIPISYLNPLSFGHKINHPPPDTSPNVKFIDIFIPYNFFPNEFLRYLPNIYEQHDTNRFKIKREKTIRAVGIISLSEIKDKEELYVDYLQEDLIPDTYRPDWLLQPPPRNPYLIKESYITKPTIIDKALHKVYHLTYGKENIEFQKYIQRDEGLDIIRANSNIKIIQNEIREENKKLGSDNFDNKYIS